jgi:hypothetical protein
MNDNPMDNSKPNDIRKRVLAVDDDPRSGTCWNGSCHGPTTSSSPPTASWPSREVRRQRPDLVLLDLRMPVMDGSEFLERVEAEGIDVPVVLMTAEIRHGFLDSRWCARATTSCSAWTPCSRPARGFSPAPYRAGLSRRAQSRPIRPLSKSSIACGSPGAVHHERAHPDDRLVDRVPASSSARASLASSIAMSAPSRSNSPTSRFLDRIRAVLPAASRAAQRRPWSSRPARRSSPAWCRVA